MAEEEEVIGPPLPDPEISDWVEKKMKKIRNLKAFRDWPEDKLRAWVELRHGTTEPLKEIPTLEDAEDIVPKGVPDETAESLTDTNSEEYKKKFNNYLNKYKREFAVDMNESNDAESLRAYVRYVIQLEQVDEQIRLELNSKMPDHRILKGLGDFQRSLQMNQNEIQDKLGISRKQRKEKVHDDVPQYIRTIREKAKVFWEKKTVPVRCEVCQVELARYWLNFSDLTKHVEFTITCEKCKQEVVYVA